MGNTEVAEQTFARLLGYNKVIRNMRMNYAIFFLGKMVDYINVWRHEQLQLDNREPSGEHPDVHLNKSRRPSKMSVMNMFDTVGGPLQGD